MLYRICMGKSDGRVTQDFGIDAEDTKDAWDKGFNEYGHNSEVPLSIYDETGETLYSFDMGFKE